MDRLEVFQRDNAKWARRGKAVPWATRVELIKEIFPSVSTIVWEEELQTELDGDQPIPVGVFLEILRTIFVVDQTQGRKGARGAIDYRAFLQTWRKAAGRDYSESPFRQTFRILARDDSVRAIARKTFISKSRVDRLLAGTERPSVDDLRSIARAYGKDPSYFHEFRAEYIVAALADRLDDDPEQTIVLYRQLMKARR
jgi:transcriptional regulator with XRE-family HTH domain